MMLKEKFIVATANYNNEELVFESVKIAEEFTIGFIVWLDKNKKETKNIVIIEELLEIYKKEKGL